MQDSFEYQHENTLAHPTVSADSAWAILNVPAVLNTRVDDDKKYLLNRFSGQIVVYDPMTEPRNLSALLVITQGAVTGTSEGTYSDEESVLDDAVDDEYAFINLGKLRPISSDTYILNFSRTFSKKLRRAIHNEAEGTEFQLQVVIWSTCNVVAGSQSDLEYVGNYTFSGVERNRTLDLLGGL